MCRVAARGRRDAADGIDTLDVRHARKCPGALVRLRAQQQPRYCALHRRALHHLADDATTVGALPSGAGVVSADPGAALIEQLRVGRLEDPLECRRLRRADLAGVDLGAARGRAEEQRLAIRHSKIFRNRCRLRTLGGSASGDHERDGKSEQGHLHSFDLVGWERIVRRAGLDCDLPADDEASRRKIPCAYSSSANKSPACTVALNTGTTSFTVPAFPALTTVSIFIASSVINGVPASTFCPTLACRAITSPGMMAPI